MLRVGDKAPDFKGRTHDGQEVDLAQLRGDGKAVVLYFYPKDETPACTAQACAFRDSYEQFVDAGAVVVGVSHDDDDSHRSFADHHRLPFLLLSDEDGALRTLYQVPKSLGFMPGRVTYVIDSDGTIAHAFNAMLKAKKHVGEALSVVNRLGRS